MDLRFRGLITEPTTADDDASLHLCAIVQGIIGVCGRRGDVAYNTLIVEDLYVSVNVRLLGLLKLAFRYFFNLRHVVLDGGLEDEGDRESLATTGVESMKKSPGSTADGESGRRFLSFRSLGK